MNLIGMTWAGHHANWPDLSAAAHEERTFISFIFKTLSLPNYAFKTTTTTTNTTLYCKTS